VIIDEKATKTSLDSPDSQQTERQLTKRRNMVANLIGFDNSALGPRLTA
jgi:hypothetical protein